jgi:DNA mismatch repair ATPase MutL
MKDILHRLALINYSITWTLIDAEKSKLLWHAPAAQSFNCRIRSLYGLSSFELKPISRQYDSFQIDGSIGVILRGATKPIAEIYVNKRSIPPTSDLVRCLTTITPETLSVLARGMYR